MNNLTEIAGIDWSADRMLPAFQTPQHLDIYNIRGVAPDVQLSITTMVGLINRPQPGVYLIIRDDDAFWLKELLGSIPQDASLASKEGVLEALLSTYRQSIQGMIIYDPNFVDSINIATTLAGQLDGIVVSPAQAQALQGPYKLPVLADLCSYRWRNRLQAYYWAQQHVLGDATTHLVAGLSPTHPSGLRSFLVATRAFVYWLDSGDFLPDPTCRWMSERSLMRQIYHTFLPGTVHLGWFIDEGSGVSLTSEAAMPVLATDFFYNLEVWASIQYTGDPQEGAQPSYSRGDPCGRPVFPAGASPAPKVYVSFTMSEGDNLQYNQHHLAGLWRDTARGSIPTGWTISPVLRQAAPSIAAYYMRTATPNDELLAGPSGAGYMFPSRWPREHLPAFLQRTGQLMQSMKMTLLEVLDSNFLLSTGLPLLALLGQIGMAFRNEALQQRFVEALSPFGIRGILSGNGRRRPGYKCVEGVPVYQNLGLASSVDKTVKMIRKAAPANRQRPLLLNVYTLAWTMTPSDLKQVMQQLGSEYEAVTPGALLAMAAAVP